MILCNECRQEIDEILDADVFEHMTSEGKCLHFCSEECRDKYQADLHADDDDEKGLDN